MEVYERLNKLQYSGAANVTSLANQIPSIYTGATQESKDNLKTYILHNTSAATIYYGANSAVVAANGIPIAGNSSKEFKQWSLEDSPWFTAGAAANAPTRLEMWG